MLRPRDLFVGQGFSRLRITKLLNKGFVVAECICGNTKKIRSWNLIKGKTKSCGCLSREIAIKRLVTHNKKHGLADKCPEYKSWVGMNERCRNKKHISYHCYGGRGISVCKRWKNSFENFLNDMGKKPSPKHSLDRIDVEGNYTPANCRWANIKTQNRNRRQTIYFNFRGKRKSLIDLVEEYSSVDYQNVYRRIYTWGWTLEEALTIPKRGYRGI
jgi:hypothetical protein